MARDGELAALAESIGKDLASSRPTPKLRELGRIMAGRGLAGELVRCAFAEARSKRPKTFRIDGFVYLLGEVLEELRLSSNGGDVKAQREVAETLALIGAEASKAAVDPGLLVLMARALKYAGLEPPGQIHDAMVKTLNNNDGGARSDSNQGIVCSQLDEMAEAFDQDPFLLHLEFAANAAAFPLEGQVSLIETFFDHPNSVVRAAGLGFLLSQAGRLSEAALASCLQSCERYGVDQAIVSRLVIMRPWLASQMRSKVDQAIAHLRRTAPAAQPAPAAHIEHYFSTMCDGAGVQSIFALVRLGLRWGLVSVLTKDETGVADVWSAKGMSKKQAGDLIASLFDELGAEKTSAMFFRRRLEDALAVNVNASPPPFGLVEACELLGLGVVAPRRCEPRDLIEELLADAPEEQTNADALARAHAASMSWAEHAWAADSWFEAGAEIEALLKPIRGRPKREAAVISQILPLRRDFWLRQLAWTAAALKDQGGLNPMWREMALVGRALGAAEDVGAVPFMRAIAAETVRAFAQQ